jgi:O-antigen ligase
MTTAPAPPRANPMPAVGALALGFLLALILYRFPPPLPLALAGGLALVGVLVLAITHYHAAVALAFGLLGIVIVEPAPADGVFGVLLAIAIVSRRFRLTAVPMPIIVAIGAFVVLNLLSAVQVADMDRAASFFIITLFVAAVGLWLPSYLNTRGKARLILRAYLVAAVSSAVLGVLALFAPIPGTDILAEGGRAKALFQDPNVFGPFLIPALLFVIEEILNPRLLRSGLPTKAVAATILALGVLFCYSRGAWLNLALALLVMGIIISIRRGGARRALALVAIAATAGAVVAGTVIATGSGDFLAERARPQTYDQDRFGGQRASLETARTYPFGAGPGQFESLASISAHSTYARVLGEQGFPGLVALGAMLGLTLIFALRNALAGRGTFGIGSAALLGAWCGLLANSFFIDTLHWRHLWIVAALIWAGAMREGLRAQGVGRGGAADDHGPELRGIHPRQHLGQPGGVVG